MKKISGKVDMTVRKRPVAIMQLPERSTRKEAQIFTREVERSMTATRPYVVLDCSKLEQLDKSTVQLLLHCLEEAMKRNGDVKLAGVPVSAHGFLETAVTNRLFEIFDTPTEAVNSFHQLPFEDLSGTGKSESAA
jgi:anti-anti-sigma regulatory factor